MKHSHLIAAALMSMASAPLMAEPRTSESKASSDGELKWAYTSADVMQHGVINQEGERLGDITELVFDKSGRISHFVLSRGGIQGIGDTHVLIPWSALGSLKQANNTYVVDIDASRLEDAPTLSPNDLQHLTNPALAAEVDKHFRMGRSRDHAAQNDISSEKIRQTFTKHDKNGDGVLDRDEARNANLMSEFDAIDTDDGGTISRAEYSRHAVNNR